jgi:hypothetical protein
MNVVLSTRIAQFETDGRAASYDQWFQIKVEASLKKANDPSTPRYSTEEVMCRMDKIIKSAEVRHAAHRAV